MDSQSQENLQKLSLTIKVLIPFLGIYLALGAVFYSIVEKWSLFDSLYFSVITVATVGYGDLTPNTVLGKTFTMFYLFIGIGLFVYVANTFLRYRAMLRVQRRINRKSAKLKS